MPAATRKWTTTAALACALGLASSSPWAQTAPVQADAAWARPTVVGQMSAGAFMRLTAKSSTQLVGVASPVAGVAEVHEMKMDGDIMRMRAVPVLDLPAGKTVEFKPGGYHVMLMDLKEPLVTGASVPLTLLFKNPQGQASRLEVKLKVDATAPGAAARPATASAVPPSAPGMAGHKH